jgi:hypothetical protein
MSQGFFSRGFRGRRQPSDQSARIPPGQYLERGFPGSQQGPRSIHRSRTGISPLSVRLINQNAGAGTNFAPCRVRR